MLTSNSVRVAVLLIAWVCGCASSSPSQQAQLAPQVEMVPLGDDVLVESELSLDERARISRAYATALKEVARRFAPLEGPRPLAIFCKTDRCRMFYGGGLKRSWMLSPGDRLAGATYVAGPRSTMLVFRLDERAPNVIAHETVHVEIDFRVHHARLPLWFHEGVAALVSDEPRCSGREGRGVDDLRRLDGNTAWAEYTSIPGALEPTYCQARGEVDAWVRRFGKDALFALFDKVRDGASFQDVYGPMQTQDSGPIPTVLVSSAPRLGDPDRAFSIAMWIKAAAPRGVLAHVSETSIGTGWCEPFLGFDRDGRLVAQIFSGESPDASSFTIAADSRSLPFDHWIHVAMTWAPGASSRLYVDGVLAAEAKAPRYNAPRSGRTMFVAWGTSNVGGATCWPGAIPLDRFEGVIAEPRVFDTALAPAQISELARTPP